MNRHVVGRTRSEGRRQRAVLRRGCDACNHPWLEHPGWAESPDPASCGECLFEIEHEERQADPCSEVVPVSILREAEPM
ncbi:hypothetical protein [Frondihabitans sp. 762G35]|uniref:hypothetical protein n=1 Tax=Frondihabitans sp. 762G35 TaxID=1446794 RepID=UPI000F501A53|nr:hypothetical protein [Frondihabitans sp. 762G35]